MWCRKGVCIILLIIIISPPRAYMYLAQPMSSSALHHLQLVSLCLDHVELGSVLHLSHTLTIL